MPVTIPPFTNVPAPNDPVKSDWAQQLTQFAVDQIVSQPDTPASPNTELWYDTDDAGASFPNMPRGFVGYDVTTGTVAIGTSNTEIGARVTWTADPSRRYKTTVFGGRIDDGATKANIALLITNAAGGGTVLLTRSWTVTPGDSIVPIVYLIESGLSGVQTRNAMVQATATGAIIVGGTFVLVEDIGSAGQSGGGGAQAVTPWTAITLMGSWVNLGGAYQIAQYRKVGDIVYVRGMIKGGSGAIVILPVGFRPPAQLLLTTSGDDTISTLSIDSAGTVSKSAGGTNANWLSINCSFSVSVA